MRTFSTSVMALLIIAALFWGNCFSCPQVLVAAQKHGCCPHTKSSKTECQTQGLKNFVKAERSAPAVITVAAVVDLPAPASESAAPLLVPRLQAHAPPDTLPLRI
ncbi:MAG TPA: hypothetical protein VGF49_12320 [Candidatus Solibacter sp.]|jgi:hypothetical protein